MRVVVTIDFIIVTKNVFASVPAVPAEWRRKQQHFSIDLLVDSLLMLCWLNNIVVFLRQYPVSCLFAPNEEDVVTRTIDIFFEDTTEDSDSIGCRNTEAVTLHTASLAQ